MNVDNSTGSVIGHNVAVANGTMHRRGKWMIVQSSGSSTRGWLYRIGAIVLVLAVGILYLVVTVHVPDLLGRIVDETFGTTPGIQELAVLATPFFLTGLAVLIPLRIGLWNIGGEGQFFAGAWMATGFAFVFPRLPGPILIVLMLIAGTVGGAVWAVIPAIAKAYLNVNEIITTLMLDLAVVFWVDYWISGPWHYTQSQGGVLESRFIPQQAHLPAIAVAGGVDSGLAIAVLITLVVGIVLKYTIAGYRSQIVGAGQRVASFAGMRAKPTVIVTLLVGAALAGIGGVLQLIGNSYQLTPGLSNNTGYLGIAVAVVAGGTVAGIVAMSVLLAVIMSAGQVVQLYGVSSDDVFILIGLLLILSTIATVLNRYKLVRTSDLDDSSTTRDGKSTTKAVSIALSEGQEAGVAAGGAR